MAFNYKGVTPKNITYKGSSIKSLTYKGTTVWKATTPFSFTYTGTYETEGDLEGNFIVRFKTSGTLTIIDHGTNNPNGKYDIFLVGGGGTCEYNGWRGDSYGIGGGGGGGNGFMGTDSSGNYVDATPGEPNTGGGGGGGRNGLRWPGNGGSGIVCLRNAR